MFRKKLLFTGVMIVFCFLCACSLNNSSKTNSIKSPFELYARADDGVVRYVQIDDLLHLKYKGPQNINLREKGMIIDDMIETAQNKIYCSIYRTGNGDALGKSLCVLSNGKIEKSIKLKTSVGPNTMFSDIEKNRVYVLMAVQPASYNPDGNIYNIIDTSTDLCLQPFYMKGCFFGRGDIKQNLIYTTVDAISLGFEDIPPNYIAAIDRDSYKINILTKNGFSGGDMKIAQNNNIYVLNGDKLEVYKLNGTFLEEFNLGVNCNRIVINEKGVAYLCNDQNGDGLYSGNSILVFDTNTKKVVDKIEGFEGCSDIYLKDKFLFTNNFHTGNVSVIDTDNNKKIGDIHLGNAPITKLIVLKT